MNIDTEKLLLDAIKDGITKAVESGITGYQSPLHKPIRDCIEKHQHDINLIINDAITACVKDDAFKTEIVAATRKMLARTLISRVGGEIEKQVNQLKADPTTRARITMAIDGIIKEGKVSDDNSQGVV